MNTILKAVAKLCSIGLTIAEQAVAFGAPRPAWYRVIYSQGVQTLDEAVEVVSRWKRFPGVGLRVTLHTFCGACKMSGIKKGTKRKPCPACDGTGRTDVHTVEVPS